MSWQNLNAAFSCFKAALQSSDTVLLTYSPVLAFTCWSCPHFLFLITDNTLLNTNEHSSFSLLSMANTSWKYKNSYFDIEVFTLKYCDICFCHHRWACVCEEEEVSGMKTIMKFYVHTQLAVMDIKQKGAYLHWTPPHKLQIAPAANHKG